jgi:hypothetical protein
MNQSSGMTSLPEPLPALHKTLRVAMAAVAERLGRAPGPDAELMAEADAVLGALAWRSEWVAAQLLPLLEQHEPGAAAPALRELQRLDGPIRSVLEALRALPMQPPAEQAAAWWRLYRRWTLLQSQALALLHHDETTWLPALWSALPAATRGVLHARLSLALPAVLRRAGGAALTPREQTGLMPEGAPHA